MYGLLVLVGIVMNCGMMYHIMSHKLHRDPTYAFLINIAISDLIKCVFVLPLTLAVLLIDNWIFGQFLCYFLPILQDIPIHVSMMTYLLIACDRYRFLSDSRRPRIPAFVCALGAWFFAVCIILPHPIYTTYYDLEMYEKKYFRGLGLCLTNLTDNIEQYIRGLFLLTYVAPLVISVYIYVKSGRELRTLEGSLAIALYRTRAADRHPRVERNTLNGRCSIRREEQNNESPKRTNAAVGLFHAPRNRDLYEVELDACREKRTQRFLACMIALFAILFCPLMVLRLARLSTVETYENVGVFDVTFTLFIWIAFLSTITTPSLYVAWQRNRAQLACCDRCLSLTSENSTEMTAGSVSRNAMGVMNVAYGTNSRNGKLANENSEGSRGMVCV
ncbi:neuropeptide Y receptor type 2 isoform X2 [Venturia canescens]|nr:neuropeptide Y receptor type 2 isoform X2 [Venturia canescens]